MILAKPSEAAAAAESISVAVRKRNTPLDSPACCAWREAYRLKTKRKVLLILEFFPHMTGFGEDC